MGDRSRARADGVGLVKALLVLAWTSVAHAETWSFDADKADAKPAGFTFTRTGSGPAGAWIVKQVGDAPSGQHVLAQTGAKVTDKGFPVAIANAPKLADATVSVKCKPIAGKIDQVCGLVVRYQDADTYYVSRANALEDNVRIYRVIKGVRKTLGEAKVKVATATWHEHSFAIKGDRLVVTFDGKQVLDVKDTTIGKAGRIGLWTKADTTMYFDDLAVAP
jgi:hypothetical protein